MIYWQKLVLYCCRQYVNISVRRVLQVITMAFHVQRRFSTQIRVTRDKSFNAIDFSSQLLVCYTNSNPSFGPSTGATVSDFLDVPSAEAARFEFDCRSRCCFCCCIWLGIGGFCCCCGWWCSCLASTAVSAVLPSPCDLFMLAISALCRSSRRTERMNLNSICLPSNA